LAVVVRRGEEAVAKWYLLFAQSPTTRDFVDLFMQSC
jgi:hypothetical protein